MRGAVKQYYLSYEGRAKLIRYGYVLLNAEQNPFGLYMSLVFP